MNKAEEVWRESERERVEIEEQMGRLWERVGEWASRRTIIANELGLAGVDIRGLARNKERISG